MTLVRGSRILHRFRVGERLQRLPWGSEHAGRDQQDDAPVLVRSIRKRGRPDFERLRREEPLLHELRGKGILSPRGPFRSRNGHAIVAMDAPTGRPLRDVLDEGPLDLPTVVAIGRGMAAAIDAVHSQGVTHGCLCPENVWISDGDEPTLEVGGFEVARILSSERLLRLSAREGKCYLAPEQLMCGQPVGCGADVYGLGCILYECLTGRAAITGSDPLVICARTIHRDAPPMIKLLPGMPWTLAKLLNRMLRGSVDEREACAADLVRWFATEAPEDWDHSLVAEPFLPLNGENLMTSVLFVRPHSQPDALDLVEVAEPFGASARLLVNGVWLVLLVDSLPPVDHARNAARCALAIKRELGRGVVAMATGHASLDRRFDPGSVAESAANLMRSRFDRRDQGLNVRLADPLVDMLDSGFSMVSSEGRVVLEAELKSSDPNAEENHALLMRTHREFAGMLSSIVCAVQRGTFVKLASSNAAVSTTFAVQVLQAVGVALAKKDERGLEDLAVAANEVLRDHEGEALGFDGSVNASPKCSATNSLSGLSCGK